MGEEKEMLDPNVVGRSMPQCCRCNELEERCKKAEVRCEELGFELQKKKEHCEELGAKVMALEGEKFEFEDKVKVLSKGLERLIEVSGGEIKPIVDLAEDNDKVLQCEKIRAESEVEVWKVKYKKLESWAVQFGMGRDDDEENGKEQESKPISNEGNLHLDTSFGFWQNLEKVAALGNKKIRDIQSNPVPDRQGSESISVSTCFAADGKESNNSSAQKYRDSLDLDENLLFLKRKHIQEPSSDQVRPDSSSSPPANIQDDKVTDTVMTRRRLRPLRKCARKSQDDKISSCRPRKAKNQQSIPTNDDADSDDESEEDLSYSEGENMSDFIVDDSDVSNCEDTSSTSQDVANSYVQDSNMESYSQDVLDEDMDFGKILSKIQRSKTNMKWEFEAGMLAAFGKDPELCMKAVCALYRQQTSVEQLSKGALLSNQRGFNKFDAYKGSILAEFLTDGDPYGGLKKSMKELQENDQKAVELCRSLATHYSKQLYEIYKNKRILFSLARATTDSFLILAAAETGFNHPSAELSPNNGKTCYLEEPL
ncbi:hypothetical protein GYH30_035084 [Glycine max]|uniref:Uncharacterized protein n=1 Tax=Glycine max TaxID=3847 RepID=A0A0R0GI30_SOYBN|nr:hypothetical protein GYH30_035084 [Glycine max]